MSLSASSDTHHYKKMCFIFRKNHNRVDCHQVTSLCSTSNMNFVVRVEEMFLTFDHLLFLLSHSPCQTKESKNMSKNYFTSHKYPGPNIHTVGPVLLLSLTEASIKYIRRKAVTNNSAQKRSLLFF